MFKHLLCLAGLSLSLAVAAGVPAGPEQSAPQPKESPLQLLVAVLRPGG
jgi:hypothetical protein